MDPPATEARGRPADLLLIEDNHGDVVLTREALRSAGIANWLTVARDGEEALEMLRRRPPGAGHARPGLILLDLHLPCMDGRQVLRALRADPALRPIPVIVLAGSNAELDGLRRRGPPADGYLVKPLDPDRLVAALARLPAILVQQGAGAGQADA